ncbi:MAG: hypothetical protein SFY66_03375 [Oculatellaceae cyanobacterium bins.114]|nr:hypothetical protein [Oculatellaceae cyanobacterium bins.114]
MESFLTQATVVIEVLSAGYLAGSFAIYAHHRLQHTDKWRPQTSASATQSVSPKPTQEPTTARRKSTPVEELRKQCQQAGIKWRNAHGKNKHLKKAEMIEALQQLRVTTMKPRISQPKPTIPQKRAA